jgi:hypothetical protein
MFPLSHLSRRYDLTNLKLSIVYWVELIFLKNKTNSNPPITENRKSGLLNWGEYQI